jgi:carbon-monoxide dehydrogenase medium subunit
VISTEIRFHAPRTEREVLELLADDDGVTVLAGGMSLMPMMNLGLVKPTTVVSLNHLDGLRDVREEGGVLVIGACVTHARVAADPAVARCCPSLASAARVVGDTQVRNRGTIGGSICHADPSADYLPVLAAAGGRVTLTSTTGTRTLPIDEFLVDFMFTAREPGELVTSLSVPSRPPGSGSAYRRLARVEGSFAIVNAAAAVSADRSSAVVALGGVGPKPVTFDASAHLAVEDLGVRHAGVSEAAFAASEGATGDIQSDGEYRREMARVLACRALDGALAELAGPSSNGGAPG